MTNKIKRTFRFKITKQSEAGNLCRHIMALDMSKKWEAITKPFVKDRSIPQNSLAFKWYSERGAQNRNGAHLERMTCKFLYGCPILIEQESDSGESAFTEFYTNLIERYTYEECIQAMKFIEVTSNFKVKYFVKYLTMLEQISAEEGIHLSHPDDSYWEAMGIKK